jgi:protoporphyrinogen oxidase
MIEAGFKPPVILEASDRVGGKSHTKTFDQYPQVPHEV